MTCSGTQCVWPSLRTATNFSEPLEVVDAGLIGSLGMEDRLSVYVTEAKSSSCVSTPVSGTDLRDDAGSSTTESLLFRLNNEEREVLCLLLKEGRKNELLRLVAGGAVFLLEEDGRGVFGLSSPGPGKLSLLLSEVAPREFGLVPKPVNKQLRGKSVP